uniref:Uncharacterized protein n=1 Tax=Romanomermis culicivorax TaxID=13658 RepID=A0A915KDT6_ROMCU
MDDFSKFVNNVYQRFTVVDQFTNGLYFTCSINRCTISTITEAGKTAQTINKIHVIAILISYVNAKKQKNCEIGHCGKILEIHTINIRLGKCYPILILSYTKKEKKKGDRSECCLSMEPIPQKQTMLQHGTML